MASDGRPRRGSPSRRGASRTAEWRYLQCSYRPLRRSLFSTDPADGGVDRLGDLSFRPPLVAGPGLPHRHPTLLEDVFPLDIGQFFDGHEPGHRLAAKHNLDWLAYRAQLPDEFRHPQVV